MKTKQGTMPHTETSSTSRVMRRSLVVERVMVRLSHDPYFAGKPIRCDFHEGALIMHGRVSSFYLKQVAQSLAAEVDGVQQVVNYIEVSSQTGTSSA